MSPFEELAAYQLQTGGVPLDGRLVIDPSRLGSPRVLHFGNAQDEYQAALSESALFDTSDRGQIELTGKDARAFVHNFCTNDVKRLTAGEGCEAFMTNVKGRILAHVFVFVTRDSVWIDLPADHDETIAAHLDHYHFQESVEIRKRTENFGELYAAGPHASDHLRSAGLSVPPIAAYQHAMSEVQEWPVVLRRVDLWQTPGFLISASREHLVNLWQLLSEHICPARCAGLSQLPHPGRIPRLGC